jgi:AcrR family transcriptional regulator
MSWHRRGKGSYHHGNLKEALVRAALELIAEKGPAGFTFAEAARFAGVSPAAPYRHFRDRDELLADVARRGFEKFEAALDAAWNNGAPDPFAAFDRTGKAYLQFARSEPAYYSAMFEAGIPPNTSAELAQAGERAFAVLRRAADAMVATLPAKGRPPARSRCPDLSARSRCAGGELARRLTASLVPRPLRLPPQNFSRLPARLLDTRTCGP